MAVSTISPGCGTRFLAAETPAHGRLETSRKPRILPAELMIGLNQEWAFRPLLFVRLPPRLPSREPWPRADVEPEFKPGLPLPARDGRRPRDRRSRRARPRRTWFPPCAREGFGARRRD